MSAASVELSSTKHLVLVALKFAPVHNQLMSAYRDAYVRSVGPCAVTWIVADEYETLPRQDRVVRMGPGSSYGIIARSLLRQWGFVKRFTAESIFGSQRINSVHVLVQAAHPANALLMRKLRKLAPGVSIRYYLHEPTSWFAKLRKRDGAFGSAAVYLTQCLDLHNADLFYTAHDRALKTALAAFPIPRLLQRGRVMPLPFRDLCPEFDSDRLEHVQNIQILFLGRADQTRCVDVFFNAARVAERRSLGWRFVLLTPRTPDIPGWARQLPNLQCHTGRPYSDDDMVIELRRSRYVFNLFRVPYTQSGVTPVALMFGVPVIAHAQEREPELEAAGCIYFQRIPDASRLVTHLETRTHIDRAALRNYYLRTYDSSVIRIPHD